jgi:hypothetical protein
VGRQLGNPAVLREYASIILDLANRGVDVLRLDAIAFLWKRLGTDCQGEPEVHALTQVLRAVTRIACPAVAFKAEAIVAPTKLLPYLGTGAYTARSATSPTTTASWCRSGRCSPRRTCGWRRTPSGAAAQAHDGDLADLPALPRRHRLGDHGRGCRCRRAERARAPKLPLALVRR